MKVRDDRGSTIPLILGFFLVAFVLVAGAVATGNAYLVHRDLQGICDGAAAAAVNSVDAGSLRGGGISRDQYLTLGHVDQAVVAYLSRDPTQDGVHVEAAISPDKTIVMLRCTRTSKIAFGAMFGMGGGITNHVTSQARAPIRQ
ncbi:MAG: Tad domain-containing protein [Actinobacteria bacterium]|nr:Tad domain-containing protein [Actinomycetota bacterium]